MASGIRVIGGNKDGTLDPLGDEALGTLIDPHNGDELASAICTALSTGPANADGAIRFNASAFTEHLQALVVEFYRRSLNAPRSSATKRMDDCLDNIRSHAAD
jgi:hypothetical protein